MNRSANGLVIVVFRTSNGMGWHYCPKAALADPRIGRAMRYSDEEGYATLAEALNAVAHDRSIPKTTPIEVEDIGPSYPTFPAAAKTDALLEPAVPGMRHSPRASHRHRERGLQCRARLHKEP